MKQTKGNKIPVFTVADHPSVQQQIENRAYELWRMRCQQDPALDDWLRAEFEILQDFLIKRQSTK
jgi:hypothetical protein